MALSGPTAVTRRTHRVTRWRSMPRVAAISLASRRSAKVRDDGRALDVARRGGARAGERGSGWHAASSVRHSASRGGLCAAKRMLSGMATKLPAGWRGVRGQVRAEIRLARDPKQCFRQGQTLGHAMPFTACRCHMRSKLSPG